MPTRAGERTTTDCSVRTTRSEKRRTLAAWSVIACALLALPACGEGGGGMDAGSGGGTDARVGEGGTDAARDASTMDAGSLCGGAMCEPFQRCVSGSCTDYPPCAGDNTCPAGSTCHARYCVPDDVDVDGDGSPAAMDCDETDEMRSPLREEICNGVDDDCDETTDEGDPVELCEFYPGGGECIMGSCGCAPGTFDLDRTAPGCECTAAPAVDQGLSCENAIDLGAFADDGAMMMVTGNVLPDDRIVWYRFRAVDRADDACDNFHVRARLATNPDNVFAITVSRGSCGDETCPGTLTDYTWATDLRRTEAGRLAGQCPCYPMGSAPQPNVSVCANDSADYFVSVRRRPGARLSCESYALEIGNGVYDTM